MTGRRLAGRRAVVTGASRGIGTARRFGTTVAAVQADLSDEVARVSLIDRSSGTAMVRPEPPSVIPEPGTAMAMYGSSKAALNRLTNGLGAVMVSLDLIDGDLISPGGLTVHSLDGSPIARSGQVHAGAER